MRLRFSVPLFFFCCVFVHGVFAGPFPPPGMSLPEYWGEEHVWWDGRAAFHAFDGVRGETPDKFNLSGQAKGINLQIADARGNIARAGKVMPAIPLTGNEEALDYTLRIVRNGKKLEAGNYFAVLGFRVDYE